MKPDQKTRKKALLLLIIIFLAMLIPIRIQYKDGGTVKYKAVFYSVTDFHQIASQDYRLGTIQGRRIRVFFWNVYDNTEFIPDDIEHVLSPAE